MPYTTVVVELLGPKDNVIICVLVAPGVGSEARSLPDGYFVLVLVTPRAVSTTTTSVATVTRWVVVFAKLTELHVYWNKLG